MAGRFIATPEVAEEGIPAWLISLLNALKENVDLLTATRGEAGNISAAVVRNDVTPALLGQQELVAVTAQGNGFTISSQDVASLAEFAKLISDVQVLANDLYVTRQTLDALITAMRDGAA